MEKTKREARTLQPGHEQCEWAFRGEHRRESGGLAVVTGTTPNTDTYDRKPFAQMGVDCFFAIET